MRSRSNFISVITRPALPESFQNPGAALLASRSSIRRERPATSKTPPDFVDFLMELIYGILQFFEHSQVSLGYLLSGRRLFAQASWIADDNSPPLIVLQDCNSQRSIYGILVHPHLVIAICQFVDIALERCKVLVFNRRTFETGLLDPFETVLRKEIIYCGSGILAAQVENDRYKHG